MNKEKLNNLKLKELIELKNCVNEIVLRTHITGTPSVRWKDFNDLLMSINKKIEDIVYHEFFE